MLRALKKYQAGVTLFEVLLVLFVAAFIAAAVATIYAKVTLTFKQNQLQTGIQQLAANITATYTSGSGADYSSLATGIVISGGLSPDDMHSGTTPINPFVSQDGWSVGPGDSTSTYKITVNSVPDGACSTLYGPLSKISSAQSLTVNGTAVDNPGTALQNCTKGNNTIILFVN